MSCDAESPTLFDLGEPSPEPGAGPRTKARRIPERRPLARERHVQVHLPVFEPGEAELVRLGELAARVRPTHRGDCEQEARPCPWVACVHHLYSSSGKRLLEFEALIDAIPDVDQDEDVDQAVVEAILAFFDPGEDEDEDGGERTSKRPKTQAEAAEAVRAGHALVTRTGDALRSDVLSSALVASAWPTCDLDVAADVESAGAELSDTDTARLLGLTREALRLMGPRVAPDFAAAVREWLEEYGVSEARLSELVEEVARRRADAQGRGE